MQFILTKQELKLIARLAREKRNRLKQFRNLYYSQPDTKMRMDEETDKIDALISKLLIAIKTRRIKTV